MLLKGFLEVRPIALFFIFFNSSIYCTFFFVVKVLQIIPQTMFGLLARIIQIQTTAIQELPTRLEKDKMKEYAQLDSRYEVLRLEYKRIMVIFGYLS